MDISGLHLELIPDGTISPYANATLELSEATDGRAALKYAPEHVGELGYLVAHECGHLIRLYSVPEEKRLVPVTTSAHFGQVLRDSIRDLDRLYRKGLPEAVLADMMGFLHEGVVRQVMNFPADCRIERWLYEEHPGLRDLQTRALGGMIQEHWRTTSPEIRDMTPRKMFRAANVMNAAYARYLSRLLGDRRRFTPYRRTEFAGDGRFLADRLWESQDHGYRSDVDDSRGWAEFLAIDRWFEWRQMREVQRIRAS